MSLDWRFILGAFGVLWIGYVFAGYPLLLAVVSRLRRVRPVASEDFVPTVSVLIAARNEEKDIEWKVRETLGWDYPAGRLDVWVASDASDDRTDEILKTIDNPRLHVVRMECRGGKNRALNRMANLAQAEILFFSDANSHVEGGCLRRMVRHFADSRVGCVTGNSNKGAQDEPSSGLAVYWGHELLIRRFENECGSVLVCDGAIFCMRRSLYVPCLPELANDLELPLRIGGAGYWLLHEPRAQVLEKETSSPSEEFSRRRRICAQGALGMWKLRRTLRGLRAWQFFSHKVLRWLLAIPLTLLLLSSLLLAAHNRYFLALFGLQAIFWGSALAGLMFARIGKPVPEVLSPLVYFLVSSLGALIGVFDACEGRKFDIWDSPSLTRGGSTSGEVGR